jgi:hypothetical protein
VYLWAIPVDGRFYPHYVGEAESLHNRRVIHRGNSVGNHFKSADGPNVWDQTYGPTHERNKRLESQSEIRIHFAAPDGLVGVPTELIV